MCHGTLSVHQRCVAILQGFRLGVKLVCPSVMRVPSLRKGFRLDVTFVSLSLSLCHARFPPSLLEMLRLDVNPVSLCYNVSFCSQDGTGGIITRKIRDLQGLYLKGYNTTFRN